MNRRAAPLSYRPALDGIRAVAVLGVLAYHSGFSWAKGGYLGVSAFFTLSGFLIATLLLREHNRDGTIDLRRFWTRRFKRLLPASLLGILGASIYAVAVLDDVLVAEFRADALAALAYVANWRFILNDLSYAELFAGDTPIQHFWSLAIEEQFYLVFPLLVLGVFAATHGSRRAFAAVIGVAIALSVLTTLVVSSAGGRQYYGTDTRAAELLVGVGLALVFERWPDRGRAASYLERTARTWAAVGAAVVMAAMWVLVPQDASWLQPWGLLLHAGLAAVLIREAVTQTWVASALGASLLRWLGKISYGVYVYHWPIFLATGRRYPELDPTVLFLVRVGLTLGVAWLSYVLVETPIRTRKRPLGRFPALVPAGAVAATALVVVALVSTVDRTSELDAAQAVVAAPRPVDAAPIVDEDLVVSVFGDSTALLVARGLKEWSERTGAFDFVAGYTPLGCGVGRGGLRQLPGADLHPTPEGCDWEVPWRNELAAGEPTVAVVLFGSWDAIDRRIEGDDQIRTLGDPVYDAFLQAEMQAAADLLLTEVDTVVWLTQAPPAPITKPDGDPLSERIQAFNRLAFAALSSDDDVRFVDLAGWIQAWPGGVNDLSLRPDGTHFSNESALIAAEWLGPAIVAAVDAAPGSVIEVDDVEPVPTTAAGDP